MAGDNITLERFDDYYGDAPLLKTVVCKFISENSARAINLENGDVNFVMDLQESDFNRIAEGEETKGFAGESTSLRYFGFNTQHAPLDNVNVRKALIMAIDLESIRESFYPLAAPSDWTVVPPALQDRLTDLEPLPYDPEEYWVLGEAGKVLRGLEKGAGEIRLGCSRKMADGLEAAGYRLEGEGTEEYRHFKLPGKIRIIENYYLNETEDVDGFRVLGPETLEFQDWMELRDYGLIPDAMKSSRSEHYIFHYPEGSLAEEEIQHITEIQEECFRRICNELKVEPDFPIHYFLLSSPEEVGYIHKGGGRCNGFTWPPEKVFVTYNEKVKSYGAHEVAHLISRLAGHPDSEAVEEGLSVYFDGDWWGIDLPAWVLYYLSKGKCLKLVNLLDNEYFRQIGRAHV